MLSTSIFNQKKCMFYVQRPLVRTKVRYLSLNADLILFSQHLLKWLTFIAMSRILCDYFIGAGRLFDFIVSWSVCLSVSLLGGDLISFLEILTIGEKISLIIWRHDKGLSLKSMHRIALMYTCNMNMHVFTLNDRCLSIYGKVSVANL